MSRGERAYTHDDLVRLVLADLPELEEEFREDADLMHLQMATFARRIQQAKGAGDWETYKRCIRIADELWRRPDAELLNALNVSYLENLDFDGPRGPHAWGLLTPELQRGWREMQAYLARLAALPTKKRKDG